MIAIVDYGTSNLSSVINAFQRLSVEVAITGDPDTISQADKIVLPGVGSFGDAMWALRKRMLVEVLNETVCQDRKPVLGICLGMQILARHSEEGNIKGLGWLPADIIRIRSNDCNVRVPHIGWNDLIVERPGRLLKNVKAGSTVYFAHSYHLEPEDPNIVLARTEHGGNWVVSVEWENIFGVQFHPEKSHDVGLQVLSNFAES